MMRTKSKGVLLMKKYLRVKALYVMLAVVIIMAMPTIPTLAYELEHSDCTTISRSLNDEDPPDGEGWY